MLGECHAHIFMNGYDYPAARAQYEKGVDRQDIRKKLAAYQAGGVTFIRDGGDHYGACSVAKELAGEYGIDYRIPVFAIHKKGCYGGIVGKSFENIKEYADLVKKAAEGGADFIKIMLSGIMDFAGDGSVTGEPLGKELTREMIHIAHEEGFAVMAHVNGDRAIRHAIEGGADSIEHGNFMKEETILALAKSHTVWVPTHVTIHNLRGCGRFSEDVLERLEEDSARNIHLAYAQGAMIAAGSDAGAYQVRHADGIREEEERLLAIIGDDRVKVRAALLRAQGEIMTRFRRQ